MADVELTTPNSWLEMVKPAMVTVSVASWPEAEPEPYVIEKDSPVLEKDDEDVESKREVERHEEDVQPVPATQRSAEPVSKMR